MAAVTGGKSAHATLTTTTVDTVTLAGTPKVRVLNASGTADLWVTALRNSGTGASAPADPVANAADTVRIPASQWAAFTVDGGTNANPAWPTVVKVLGNGNAYSVEAV